MELWNFCHFYVAVSGWHISTYLRKSLIHSQKTLGKYQASHEKVPQEGKKHRNQKQVYNKAEHIFNFLSNALRIQHIFYLYVTHWIDLIPVWKSNPNKQVLHYTLTLKKIF